MGRRQELERRQNLLARFGRLIAAETRIESLLTLIAEELKNILSADRCAVFLLDHYKNELWTRVLVGNDEKILRIPVGRGVAGFVAKTCSAVNLRAAYRDPRFTEDLDRLTGYQTKTLLAVPLTAHDGSILGVFEVRNKLKGSFTEEDEGLLRILATMAASFVENATLYNDLRRSHVETIYRMALVAEFRDQKDTGRHLRRMSRFSGILARAVGLSEAEAEDIRYAAPLHDIGKVAIPDSILRKPGSLTPEEYEEMKRHTIYGGQMLANAESRLLRLASRIAVGHHERYDGAGYPHGIKGEDIPLEARIVTVADVFDALISKRVYKGAWELEEVKAYFQEQRGKIFDPKIVDCLFANLDKILAAADEENRRIQEDEALQKASASVKPQAEDHHLQA